MESVQGETDFSVHVGSMYLSSRLNTFWMLVIIHLLGPWTLHLGSACRPCLRRLYSYGSPSLLCGTVAKLDNLGTSVVLAFAFGQCTDVKDSSVTGEAVSQYQILTPIMDTATAVAL